MLRNHRLNKPLGSFAAKWATMSDPKFDAGRVASNLGAVFGVADKPFFSLIERFITGLRDRVQALEPYQVQEFYDGCKARYSELYKLIVSLLDLSQAYKVRLTRADGKPFICESGEVEIHFESEFDCEDIVLDLTLNGHPKVYGLLSRAVVRAMIALASDGVDPHDYKDRLLPFLQMILSVGQLYDDLRGGSFVIRNLEDKALQGLTLPEKPLTVSRELFYQVANDIALGRQAPAYVHDLARICATIELTPFNSDDYHISLRSTGTSYGGKPLNGLSASIVETDEPSSIDSIIGYKSFYRSNPDPLVHQYGRKTITIEQKKLKRRVIHMACNGKQDRCNWFHRRLEIVLRRIASDCTFNQDAGRRFAKAETAKAFSSGRNIYSCDISAATDTISMEFQEMVLSLFFGKELSEGWRELTSSPSTFCFQDGREIPFRSSRGQPQGFKSSFPAFALAHHILMRMVMKMCGLESTHPQDFYRVLGDDSIIACEDSTLSVLSAYETLSEDIGWEINRSKGYYYFADQDTMAVAEFAKVRYCNGYSLSPLPIMLTLGLSKDKGLLPALLFRAQHLDTVGIKDVHQILINSMDYTLADIKYISLLSYMQLGPWANFGNIGLRGTELSDRAKSIILINYFRTQLYRTTLSMWLPSDYEKSITEGWTEAKKRSMIFLEWLDRIEDSSELSSDHKIWILMDKQDRLIQAIERATGEASLSYAGLGLDLTPEEMTTLVEACEIVCDFEYADPLSILRVIPEACKILSRFNPRSDSRNSVHESSALPGYATECISMLESSGELEDGWMDNFYEEELSFFFLDDVVDEEFAKPV